MSEKNSDADYIEDEDEAKAGNKIMIGGWPRDGEIPDNDDIHLPLTCLLNLIVFVFIVGVVAYFVYRLLVNFGVLN